jgi:hypothetical protein
MVSLTLPVCGRSTLSTLNAKSGSGLWASVTVVVRDHQMREASLPPAALETRHCAGPCCAAGPQAGATPTASPRSVATAPCK